MTAGGEEIEAEPFGALQRFDRRGVVPVVEMGTTQAEPRLTVVRFHTGEVGVRLHGRLPVEPKGLGVGRRFRVPDVRGEECVGNADGRESQ